MMRAADEAPYGVDMSAARQICVRVVSLSGTEVYSSHHCSLVTYLQKPPNSVKKNLNTGL